MAQLGQNEKITLHDVQYKSHAGVVLIALEEAGLEYEIDNYGMTMDKFNERKSQLLIAQIPVLTYGEFNPNDASNQIAGTGAVLRVACAAGGLLGEGRDFARSEQLASVTADFWKVVHDDLCPPDIISAQTWTKEMTKKWENESKKWIDDFLAQKYAKMLVGDDRFTSFGMSMGEIDFWYRLSQLKNGGYPDLLERNPKIAPFYNRMKASKGCSAVENHTTKFGHLHDFWVPVPEAARL